MEARMEVGAGPNLRFRPPGREKDYHVISKGDGTIWVGSTVEEVGFNTDVTGAGLEELLDAARHVYPEVQGSHVVDQWAGLRPQALRRGGPFLGRLPGAAGVWVHCGHYRSGVLLCPLTARLLAYEIMRDEEALEKEGFDRAGLEAFRVDRS
jgi:glycine/D-amino acid oxidase-like deaminating enzyme